MIYIILRSLHFSGKSAIRYVSYRAYGGFSFSVFAAMLQIWLINRRAAMKAYVYCIQRKSFFGEKS